MFKKSLLVLVLLAAFQAFAFEIKCSQLNQNHQPHNHFYYELCYLPDLKNPEWVKWHLTRQDVLATNVKRPSVKFKTCGSSSTESDYKNSGYDRGHLCPNADLNYLTESAIETFRYCNVSPQLHSFNAGIWLNLEKHTRDMAIQYKDIEIIAGPIFEGKPEYLVKTNVRIPDAFFRIVVSRNKVVGAWIIPATIFKGDLKNYQVNISEIEQKTGLLFTNLD